LSGYNDETVQTSDDSQRLRNTLELFWETVPAVWSVIENDRRPKPERGRGMSKSPFWAERMCARLGKSVTGITMFEI